ncbi:MAG: acetyl-CoA carboxylase, biotin carboxyl carrier protein [Phycisphaerae bacterium]|nr:acetyl-CoA carboxylase, biotin carboxyl carrier protein [Phycisphaerae bacterium]
MIDIRRLKELVKLMVENDLTELDLRDQEEKVTVKRGVNEVASGAPIYLNPGVTAAPGFAQSPAGASDNGTPAAAPAAAEDLVAIESPMVGTFYSSPNPDSDPFISSGSNVSSGDVVCIVEAMKVFNEIKSEVDGVIDRVLVKSGDAVEFGQPLFMVKPA